MEHDLMNLLQARTGHFKFESGHHGDTWLDLELLCQKPDRIRPFARQLAKLIERHRVEVVCGPLVEGAFVGLMVAEELRVDFTYTERIAEPVEGELFPVKYRLPSVLRAQVRGRRVAIVNDVINAGSAVRGTYFDLIHNEATPVVMASLLTLGDSAKKLAEEWKIDIVALTAQANSIWEPKDCPMCIQGIPLDT